jgi:hypothetical protein
MVASRRLLFATAAAIVALSSCRSGSDGPPDFGPSTCEQIANGVQAWLDDHKSCQQDSDCAFFSSPGCTLPPSPCGGIYNKAAWDPYVTMLAATYKTAGCFPHDCPQCPADMGVPICSNHQCAPKPM